MRCPKCGGYGFDWEDKCLNCGYELPRQKPPSWWEQKNFQEPGKTPFSEDSCADEHHDSDERPLDKTPQLLTCPYCNRESLYWVQPLAMYECLNHDCRRFVSQHEIKGTHKVEEAFIDDLAIPQKLREAVKAFDTTQCSWCKKFYTWSPSLCPFRRLESSCLYFERLDDLTKKALIGDTKWWWRIYDMLRQVQAKGIMAKCRGCEVLNPNPQKAECWLCQRSLCCPIHTQLVLRYDITKDSWNCPDASCSIFREFPSTPHYSTKPPGNLSDQEDESLQLSQTEYNVPITGTEEVTRPETSEEHKPKKPSLRQTKRGAENLGKCPSCGQGMLQWNPANRRYECLNYNCKRTFNEGDYRRLFGLADDSGFSLKHGRSASIRARRRRLTVNLPGLKARWQRIWKPSERQRGWKIKGILSNRWLLVVLGIVIIFVSIGYYPSLFGQANFARWMEVPVEVLGAILVLMGLFRRGHRRRMKLVRTLLILFVLFAGCSYAYIRLDESGKIDQWLHRSSSEGTITGNIKGKIPSLVDTISGLKVETPGPTSTPIIPRSTPAPATNTSRVWIGNSYLVGGDDNPIILVNNANAKNPSWSQLVDFLARDPTDKQKYVYNSFVCGDFAEMLHNNAEKAGWRAAYVSIELGPSSYLPGGGHGLNAFDTTDRGLVYIDCTAPIAPSGSADKVVDVVVGREYIPVSIFPQPGWESTWESMGRVSEIEVVQW